MAIKRIEVERRASFFPTDFGSLTDFVAWAVETSGQLPAAIQMDVEYGFDGELNSIDIVWYSEETDAEYNKRVKKIERARRKEKENKAKREAKEREQYERLRKKFGDS